MSRKPLLSAHLLLPTLQRSSGDGVEGLAAVAAAAGLPTDLNKLTRKQLLDELEVKVSPMLARRIPAPHCELCTVLQARRGAAGVNQKALKKDLVDALREELLKTAAEAASETAAGDDADEGGVAAPPVAEHAMAGFMSPAGKPSHVPSQPPSAEDGAVGAGPDDGAVPAGVAMVLSHTPAKAEDEPTCASPAHAAAPADQGEANDAPQSPLAAAPPVMDVVCSPAPAPAPEQPPIDEPAATAAVLDVGVAAAMPAARRESEDQMSVVTSSSAYSTVQVPCLFRARP